MPNLHSIATGAELHVDKRIKDPVRAASTGNVTISSPGTTVDGVTLNNGDRVLLKNQSTASQNGIYIFNGSASAMTRATDADSAADFVSLFKIGVVSGTINGGTYWTFTTSGTITLGSTSLAFSPETGTGDSAQSANTVKAGPTSGGAATPSYRGLVPADLGGATFGASGGSHSGGAVPDPGSSAGTTKFLREDATWQSPADGAQAANTVKAGPTSGGSATPAYRAIVAADIAGAPFVASGASHSGGAVPDPGASTGLTKFLREDATWAVPAGGGGTGGTGGSIVPIQTQTPTATNLATFSVPSGFKNIFLTVNGRSTHTAADRMIIRANGDSTTANYSNLQVGGNGSSTFSGTASLGTNGGYVGDMPGTNHTSNSPAGFIIRINDHANTTFNKVAYALGLFAGSQNVADIAGCTWLNTAAITTIALGLVTGNWATGTSITLWGEADTAPVLLTSNSNLIQETTILTSAVATIDIPTIPQGYKDIVVEVDGRGDASATNVQILFRANGDSGSNYDSYIATAVGATFTGGGSERVAQTSGQLGILTAATAPANASAGCRAVFNNYASTTNQKSAWSHGGFKNVASSTNFGPTMGVAYWRSTAAITSLTLLLSSGNFAVGTVVRVYGEPAASAGPSVGTGTRLRISANQSITSATATAIGWDTEDIDADNQHYTSSANLTGTVTKTAGSTTVTGSGTAFTTELSVGQVISVTGTATEKRVVTAIASNTSLTVNSAFVNTQSGATGARVNSAVVFRQPGFYNLEANIYSAALASGAVTLAIYLNSLTTATSGTAIAQIDPGFVNASAGYPLSTSRQFQQWDFVEVIWTQNAGTVNVLADERTNFGINARPTVIVAIPYVLIQDQKAQNTAGGTFTSGADQTRVLNTVVSDSASIASLTSNQFTLPPGTYRIEARAPARAVDRHQAWLFNTTDSAVTIRGSSAYASNASNGTSDSVVSGRFVITASKTFEIRHRCQTTSSTSGFGLEANFGAEIYTSVEIWKEG